MISFIVELGEDEYSEFLIYKTAKKAASQTKAQQFRGRFVSSILIGIPICLLIGYLRGWQKAAIIFLIYVVFINILPLLGYKRKTKPSRLSDSLVRADARKIMNDPKYKDSFAPLEYSFSDSGISFYHQNEKTETAWDLVTSMGETDKLILLETGKEITLILPKNQVPDMPALKALLAKKLSFHAALGHQIAL